MNAEANFTPGDMSSVALAETKWLYRARYTPLRDVIRGHLSARLDARRVIAQANLPKPLANVTWRVIRGTRLWRIEKVAVAEELTSHFLDGIDAGKTAHELLAAFGDPRVAAKLIRRAKKRARPWTWRGLTTGLCVATVFILTCAVAWLLAVMRQPTVTTAYYETYDAKLTAMPEAQRAWPAYRAILEKYEVANMDFSALSKTSTQVWPAPGTPEWEAGESFLANHAEMLQEARAAMARPHLGVSLSFPYDASQADFDLMMTHDVVVDLASRPDPRLHTPMLSAMHASSHGVFHQLARLVERDMLSAAHARDSERYLANVRALLGFARQRGNLPHWWNRYAALRGARVVYANITRNLAEDATWLSNDDLSALSKLTEQPVTTSDIDVDYLKLGIEDWLAHYYTKGGKQTLKVWHHYDAEPQKVFASTVRVLGRAFKSEQFASDVVGTVTSPFLLYGAPDADDVRRELDRLLVDAMRDLNRPLWEWSPKDNAWTDMQKQWRVSEASAVRHHAMSIIGSEVYQLSLFLKTADVDSRATHVAIALAQYY